MLNEKNLPQQSVEFTELVDSEMEQISGGDKFIFNPYSFAAPFGFGFPFGGGGQQQQQQQQGGGFGGKGRGKNKGGFNY